jgi:glycine/D-amino acid oxidase-like deaminating enzyme
MSVALPGGRPASPAADGATTYPDLPSRSPWIAQLEPLGPARPLDADATADVAIVGAGIAGLATAFWTLRDSDRSVLLVERDRIASGATGRNAGQLTTYFERPLASIAQQFGEGLAVEGQRALDQAHELLDLMAAETEASVRIERFDGHMGMYSLNHVLVHLRNNLVRRPGGLRQERCVISEDADFLADIPAELGPLYSVVPQAEVRALLETDDDRYRAVLSDRKGCANSGVLVQQVLAYLERAFPRRFRYVDRTPIQRLVVQSGDGGVRLHTDAGRMIDADRVVLCTNGFTSHHVEEASGAPIELHEEQRVVGTIGFMAAFVEERARPPAAFSYIRNAEIGGSVPYVYVTRRTYDRPADTVTLTCMGGPEWPYEGEWRDDLPFPGSLLETMDAEVRPFAQPARPAGLPYDFQWHGLMGYMPGRVRIIGPHPDHPALLYNLGCNGVGFLPSIHGGREVARVLAGERLAPSIFDPRRPG